MVVDKVTSLVSFSLLTVMVGSEPVKVDMKCALKECTRQFSECAANKVCLRTNACMSQCGPGSKARCLFDCGYLNKDIPLGPFVDCVARSGCANTTEFGRCIGSDSDADQSLTSISDLTGTWWAVKGLDCDGEYGYDSARACQKMEVRKTIDGGYESTASFCFATDSTCSNKQFVAFNETLRLRAPGVLLGHYFDGISEMPRYLRHRYLTRSGDYALLATCSRVKMQKAAAKHGIDLAQIVFYCI